MAIENWNQSEPNYDVGYKKPPTKNRFKKGHSGNPKGRKKGSKNKPKTAPDDGIRSIILDEAYRELNIREGDKTVTIPVAKAVVRSMAVNAAKGNTRAQKLFSEMLSKTETELRSDKQELFETAVEYKLKWEEVIEHNEKHGLPAPNPIPHPDHVIANPRDGTVRFIGPMTDEEKKDWDQWIEKKQQCQSELAECQKLLTDEPNYEFKDQVLSEIAHIEKLLAIIRKVMPDE